MARIRSIHPGIYSDEAWASIGIAARWLGMGLCTEADDNGIFEWKPLQLKMRIFPADGEDVSGLLAELQGAGIVCRYETSGKHYGALKNFCRYQNPRKPKAWFPITEEISAFVSLEARSVRKKSEPDGDEQEPVPQKSEEPPLMEDGGWSRKKKKQQPPAGAAGVDRNSYPEDFEVLWKTYKPIASPNSTKADASKAFERLSAADKAICQTGLQAYVNWLAAERRKRADTPAKHLATFINRKGWEPFMEAVANQQPAEIPRVWLDEDDPQWPLVANAVFAKTGRRLHANGSRHHAGIGAFVPAEFVPDRLKMELKGVG